MILDNIFFNSGHNNTLGSYKLGGCVLGGSNFKMILGKISWKAKYFSVRFSCYSNHQTFYQPFLGDNIQRNMIGAEIIGNVAPLT